MVYSARAYPWIASRLRPEGRSGRCPRHDKQVLTTASRCCTLLHMTNTVSPPTRPPRVSVPISADALAAFERLGKAGNMSTGRAIADWLDDTLEAVDFMASKMEQARAAPKIVMREMHAYALALADETGDMMRQISAKGVADRAEAAGRRGALAPLSAAAEAVAPPSCNTGGKVPAKAIKAKGGRTA